MTRGEISVDDAAMARRRVTAKKERERLSEIDLAMVRSAEARRVLIQEESVETEPGGLFGCSCQNRVWRRGETKRKVCIICIRASENFKR